MERLIADANEWGKANGGASDLSIDSFSDVVTAIQQIQEAQRIAGTTAAEAGTTIEGSVNSAKAAWTNLLTEFGKDDGNIEKAANNLVEAIIGDGTDENKGVLGNVIPRIETIVRNVAEQLPGIIMQVAPKVGEAFVSLIDSATGGMASRVIVALSPITEAVAGVFSGLTAWYDSNKTAIDTLIQSFSNFANVVIGVVGGAIETVAPIIGDLASATLPMLTAALDFASGFVQGFADLISNLGTAVSPLVDVFAPVVDAIGTAFVDALTWAGDQMAAADFSGFAEVVSNALQTVINFISDTVAALGGFFDGVAEFIKDPVGSIEKGFASLMSGGNETQKSVSSSFSTLNKNTDKSLGGVRKSIGATNKTELNDKKASAKVDGNAIDGTAKTAVSNVKKAIDGMKSKSVDATVTGNAKEKTIADRIWNTVAAIKGLFSKKVTVTTSYKTKGAPSGGELVASGGIRYHADGFIANNYGAGVPLDIVGEDGAEAIIPLTNKRYTRPFADTVAEQMVRRMGGMGSTNVYISGDFNDDASVRNATRTYLTELSRLGAI